MIHRINTNGIINRDSETHYAIHTQIDAKQYPQVHDFYELTLIAEGTVRYVINDVSYILNEGDLVFARPGDIHSKISLGIPVTHIILAFPPSTIDAMFDFLYTDEIKEEFLSRNSIPIVKLNHNDKIQLQSRLNKFAFFPLSEKERIKSYLRVQLINIFSIYLIPVITKKEQFFDTDIVIPQWLENTLLEMRKTQSYSEGLDWVVENSGKTKEHICRSFKKYLHKTPTEVINSLRLNYAGNLLSHTDKEIVDIAYEAGFQSLSYFYSQFKKSFGKTPKKFRETVLYN